MKINTKIITYFLGFLLLINGGFMFLCALLSYIYKDGITGDLILSGTIVSIIGLLMLFLNKNHDKQINKKVHEFQKYLDSIVVSPFNYNTWSKIF